MAVVKSVSVRYAMDDGTKTFHCQHNMNERVLIGERVREERERIGLTQSGLGIAPQVQRRYEKGTSTPGADYLAQFAKLGADVLYVVTGQRSATSPDQQQLLSAYAAAAPALRAAALAVLTSQPEPVGLRVVPVREEPPKVGALHGERVRKVAPRPTRTKEIK